MKYVPFFIPLAVSELFVEQAAALPVLPSLVVGTETKHVHLPGYLEMQHCYTLLVTPLPTKLHLWSLLQGVSCSKYMSLC